MYRVKNPLSALLLALFVLATPAHADNAHRHPPKVRVSAWYWLNAAPKADWAGDFTTMKELGFTDVLLCWGLDAAGVVTRKQDTLQAIHAANKAGLGSYLFIWQPRAQSLPHNAKFMQIDAEGRTLQTFDVFNPEWRHTQWKDYLTEISKTYGAVPGVSGYVFDDSFITAGGGHFVSYGDFEKQAFGADLPKKPGDPRWDEWVKIRGKWWEDWARDTVTYLHQYDKNPDHEIYLEDTARSLTSNVRKENTGVDFTRVARYFDAVGGYTVPHWTSEPDSNEKVARNTEQAISDIRKMSPPGKKVIFTFWSANGAEEHNPGAAQFPSAKQIIDVCEVAIKMGIRHIDMYGWRIGATQQNRDEWTKWMPAEPAPYRLTGQFPQKFMWDRPEIHDELAVYLRSLNR